MDALYEAIALVVIVSLVRILGVAFSNLMAISIPITLAMTFGFAHLLGIDIPAGVGGDIDYRARPSRGRSCGAGDSIKRSLDDSAAGSRCLARTDEAGACDFIRAPPEQGRLPSISDVERHHRRISVQPSSVVMTCPLVASRLVSMTFIPFQPLLPAAAVEKRRKYDRGRARGFTGSTTGWENLPSITAGLFLEYRCSSWLWGDFSGIG